MTPSISVALCTYNGERFLQEQLASIAAQTRLPIELVVNDDGSTDGTVPLLQRFGATAPFPVRIEVNEARLGSVQNFARAISRCTGDLIALCDQDDLWLPQKLEWLSMYLAESFCIVSNAHLTDFDGVEMGVTLFDRLHFHSSALRDPFESLLRQSFATGATMMLDRRLLAFALPIPALSGCSWEHDGWIALIAAGGRGLIVSDECFLRYRQHSLQKIGIQKRQSVLSRSRWRSARLFRSEGLTGALQDYSALAERLANLSGVDESKVAVLQMKIQHIRRRLSFPRNRLARLGAIATEVRTGRYCRFSSGLSSAIGDLVLG